LTIDRGWRGGPMYSMFGAAAATARLMGLDAKATAHAIELAVGLAFANVGTVMAHSGETPYQMGIAARNGFTAAWLAREGVSSAPEAIDGAVGFLNLFAGTFEMQDKIAGSLGRPFEIMDVTFKRYATSLRAHGPIYLALKLVHEEDIDPAAIEEVALELSPFEFGYPGPGRRSGIDTNVVYGVAGALVYKDGRLPHISKHDNPIVERLVERVAVDQADDLPTLCVRLRVRTADREYRRELIDGTGIHLFDLAGAEELLTNRHPELNLAPLIGAVRTLDTASNIRPIIELVTEA
jgi:2-methylcitrate dehydratase PrpD